MEAVPRKYKLQCDLTKTIVSGWLLCAPWMVFFRTKIVNVAQVGVLLKKQRWRGYSSLFVDKEFFHKLMLIILTTGILLVLPNLHSFDKQFLVEKHWWKNRCTNWMSRQFQCFPLAARAWQKASTIRLQINIKWFLGFLKFVHL